jgi:hypothetical protein
MTLSLVLWGIGVGNLAAQDNLDNLTRLVAMGRMRALVNEERAAAGLPALAVDARLMRAAHNYALVMADNTTQYPSHNIGKSMTERLRADEGIEGEINENIHRGGWGNGIVDTIVRHDPNGWMHYVTPGASGDGRLHRAAILNPRVTHMGVGVSRSAQDDKGYFCLIVGTSQGPREFPSGGGGVAVRPVTVFNPGGGTISFRFYMPGTPELGVQPHWSETYTLAVNQRQVFQLQAGTTLHAVSALGLPVNASTTVELDRTYYAMTTLAQSQSPDGTTRRNAGLSWVLR